MTRLPSLYISHGSPMTALHPGLTGMRLAELAASLPRPRAIMVASAHPTDEHLLPLFVALGAAGSLARRIDAGFGMGLLAMDIYRFD